jgi:hypothetical protein
VVSGETPTEINYTPTDPSLEFDVFEAVRLRLADALTRRGYGPVEAERIALYVVEVSRPVSHLLKVLAGAVPPGDEEAVSALGKIIDEAPAMEKAQRLLLRIDQD